MATPNKPPTATKFIACPFALCRTYVWTVETGTNSSRPDERTILVNAHFLKNEHIKGQHTCPASMMPYPLSAWALEKLSKQLIVFVKMMEESTGRNIQSLLREFLPQPEGDRRDGPAGGRGDRDPAPDSEAWFPPRPGDPGEDDQAQSAPTDIPRGTRGVVNNNVEGAPAAMANNQEILAAINLARVNLDEATSTMQVAVDNAHASLSQARYAMNGAISALMVIQQGAESARINDAVTMTARAVENAEAATNIYGNQTRECYPLIEGAKEKLAEHVQAILG